MCRSPKAEQLRKNCSDPNFEVTVIDDLVAGDISEALIGMPHAWLDSSCHILIYGVDIVDVMGVVHVASPMAGAQDLNSLEVLTKSLMMLFPLKLFPSL